MGSNVARNIKLLKHTAVAGAWSRVSTADDELKRVTLWTNSTPIDVFLGDDPQAPGGLSTVTVTSAFSLYLGDPLTSVWIKSDTEAADIFGTYI